MFWKKKELTPNQREIARIYAAMESMSTTSKEYSDSLKLVMDLSSLNPKKQRVSPDAILGAVANLGMTGIVLHHEQLAPITSKAFGWLKPLPFKAKP